MHACTSTQAWFPLHITDLWVFRAFLRSHLTENSVGERAGSQAKLYYPLQHCQRFQKNLNYDSRIFRQLYFSGWYTRTHMPLQRPKISVRIQQDCLLWFPQNMSSLIMHVMRYPTHSRHLNSMTVCYPLNLEKLIEWENENRPPPPLMIIIAHTFLIPVCLLTHGGNRRWVDRQITCWPCGIGERVMSCSNPKPSHKTSSQWSSHVWMNISSWLPALATSNSGQLQIPSLEWSFRDQLGNSVEWNWQMSWILWKSRMDVYSPALNLVICFSGKNAWFRWCLDSLMASWFCAYFFPECDSASWEYSLPWACHQLPQIGSFRRPCDFSIFRWMDQNLVNHAVALHGCN